jgi:hypothetical protein
MSLINDALQRAKQVQQVNPPTVHNLELRPLEKSRRPNRIRGWMLPVGFIAVGLGGILLFWSLNRHPVEAREQKTDTTLAATQVAAEPPPAAPAVITPAPAATPVVSTTPAAPAPVSVSSTGHNATNQSETMSPPPPPPPAPLKLQAIVYSEARSSAYVGGKVVFVGSRVQDFRVTAITPEAVTLVSDTKTNVLTLD